MLSAILEIEVKKYALLNTLLMNQAILFGNQDPTKTAKAYEQEYMEIINQMKNDKLASVVNRISKK